MFVTRLVLLASALFLGACNTYHLKYAAVPQPTGVNLYADYVRVDDSITVEVDTDTQPLQDLYIKKTDGTLVRPMHINHPAADRPALLGTAVGMGFQHDATNNVSYGTGLAVPAGPDRARGLTTATFNAADLGNAPWELHIKVQGVPEAVIPGVGGDGTAK